MTHECSEPTRDERENPPGQPALRYRTGTYGTFRAAMIARIPLQEVRLETGESHRPLAALTARDPTDPTIALLDAAACALDVLTFYQERHLNEAYLGTATERISLVQLARALGYEPSPGLSASGYLAFHVSPLVKEPVSVPSGTAVMALPEGSAPPPVFETSETIAARGEHNALPVSRRLSMVPFTPGDTWVWVKGVATRAERGDGLLLYGTDREGDAGSERWDFRRISAVEVDSDHDQTRLVFDRGLGGGHTAPAPHTRAVLLFKNRASLFGHNAPDWTTQSDSTQLTAWWRASGSMQDVPSAGENGRTRLLSRKPAVTQWPNFALASDPAVAAQCIDLDREYAGIVVGSWVVLADHANVEAYEVTRASTRAREDFTLTAKVTRLKLRGENLARFDRRATTVWCEPQRLERVGEPDTSAVTGASIRIEGAHASLVDRLLAVYGPEMEGGVDRGEVVRIAAASVAADGSTTTLTVTPPLGQRYARHTVVLNLNVARATHGQTAPDEVLGGGNPAVPFQRFVLRGRPLSQVPSSEAEGGAAAALTLRVGGVAWTRVPTLHGQAPDALVYALRQAEGGSTVVETGDGRMGARLPAGSDNVVASYRTGLGAAGEVAAGRATLLARRPAGIDRAVNPTAFSGGADPERPDDIRRNAPTSVLTLGRLVSIQDYQDFASSFAGVGKALAVGVWVGQRRLVHLTIASASGKALARTDPVLVELATALGRYQDPVHRVAVDSFTERWFGLEAGLSIDAARRWEDVAAAARAELAARFDFAHRRFGQGVTPAEVVTALSAVEGVRAVDLDRVYRVDAPQTAAPPALLLEARGPDAAGQTAELLLVSSDVAQVALRRMSP